MRWTRRMIRRAPLPRGLCGRAWLARSDVERFPYRRVGFGDCEREPLCNIIRMHVLKRGPAIVRKADLSAYRQLLEYCQIEVAGRIDRRPSWASDMARMQDTSGEASLRSFEKQALDLRLPDPVVTERLARRGLVIWARLRYAVHP